MEKITQRSLQQRLYKTKVCLILVVCMMCIQFLQTSNIRPARVINLSKYDEYAYYKPPVLELQKDKPNQLMDNPTV